jgi:CRP-like cAMP-binding protein
MALVCDSQNQSITLPMELLKLLGSIHPLSPECWEYVINNVEYKTLEKGAFLLKEGQVSHSVNLVASGLLRSFKIIDEKEVTTDFFWEGQSTMTVSSYEKQTPSKESVHALETTSLIILRREKIDYCLQNFREAEVIYRRVISDAHKEYTEQRDKLKTLSAKGKYVWFAERNPDLVQKIPKKYLASYLGIAMCHLSRIRL